MDRLYCTHLAVSHGIYVANQDNLLANPVLVTDSAITAVRDYMLGDIPKGKNGTGYSWKMSDGRIVKLVCSVEVDDE